MPPHLLHGTLALLLDVGSPLGVRLAAPGADPMDGTAFAASASDLPDASLTLRVFRSAAERDGYAAALSETGGNAFSWIEGPALAGTPPLLLVARWDRPRAPGEGLDEAVALSGEIDPVPAYAARRAVAWKADRERAARARTESAWRRETALVASDPELALVGVADDRVEYVSLRSGATCCIEREDGGVRVAIQLRHAGPSTADPLWRRAVEAEGLRILPDGRTATHPGPAVEGLLARIDASAARLGSVAQRIADISHAAREVDALLADRPAMLALEGLARGNLVLQHSPGMPAVQLSMRPGNRRQVSGAVLGRLYQAGLALPVWMPPGEGPWRACPGIYAATPLGVALAGGDRQAAIEAVPPMRDRHRRWQPEANGARDYGTPDEALAAWGGCLEPGDRDRLAGAARDASLDGRALPSRPDPEAWLAPVAGFAAGVLALSGPGGTLALEADPAEVAGPPRP